MTCLFYKWKFIPFDPLRMLLTPYPPPLTTFNLSSVSMNFELFFISHVYEMIWGFPGGVSGKEPTCQCRRHRCRFSPWVGKIPWRRAWQATPVSLPGEPQGQEPGRLWSTGSQRVGHYWSNVAHTPTWFDTTFVFLCRTHLTNTVPSRSIHVVTNAKCSRF